MPSARLLGVIGGIGPESTVDYYRLIIDAYRRRQPDGSYPQILINSLNLTRMIGLVTTDLPALETLLTDEITRLARAGATIGLLSANTPHIVFDGLQRRAPLPLISIVEATCAEAKRLGFSRVGLVGTRFTMQSGFYQKVFSRERIDVVVPESAEQSEIHARYMGELVNGIFRAETRDLLLAIARRMQADGRIDAVILGGTELPLLLRGADVDLPMLDTTRLHVEAAVDHLLD